MYTYEINITHHGQGKEVHFCKVALPPVNSESKAISYFNEFCNRFPAKDGFALTLRKTPAVAYTTIGYSEGA